MSKPERQALDPSLLISDSSMDQNSQVATENASGEEDSVYVRSLLNGIFPKGKIEKVLLINPPDGHRELFNLETLKSGRYANYAPYGLGMLASMLEIAGVDVRILNLNHVVLKTYRVSKEPEALDYDAVWRADLGNALDAFAPDLVGISCMFTMTFESFKRVCAYVAGKNVPLAVGGVQITNDTSFVMAEVPEARFLFTHEAENALPRFCKVVEGLASIDELRQVIIRDGERSFRYAGLDRPESTVLDIHPRYELMQMDELSTYGVMGNFHGFKPKGTRFATVLSNRGCRGRCTFCSVRNFNGDLVRQRTVDSVLDELQLLEEKYGVKHVVWLDDDLLNDRTRALRLFNGMTQRRLGITWDATNGVIAASCSDEMVHAMAESGCIALNIGMESGNPEILKQIKKPGGVRNFLKAAEVLRQHESIHARIFLMLGFPGETLRMINDTINVAMTMDLDWCGITVLQPLPGTPIYDSMVAQGLIVKSNRDEVRFNSGGFGKQNEIDRGNRFVSKDFASAFGAIGLDDIPDRNQLNDIWFYMNYHLNFHRLFHETRPEKLRQQKMNLQTLGTVISPEHCFSLYFLGFLQYQETGRADPEIINRLTSKLDSSDFWRDRFHAFGLSPEDLRTGDFRNRNVLRLEPGKVPEESSDNVKT